MFDCYLQKTKRFLHAISPLYKRVSKIMEIAPVDSRKKDLTSMYQGALLAVQVVSTIKNGNDRLRKGNRQGRKKSPSSLHTYGYFPYCFQFFRTVKLCDRSRESHGNVQRTVVQTSRKLDNFNHYRSFPSAPHFFKPTSGLAS